MAKEPTPPPSRVTDQETKSSVPKAPDWLSKPDAAAPAAAQEIVS